MVYLLFLHNFLAFQKPTKPNKPKPTKPTKPVKPTKKPHQNKNYGPHNVPVSKSVTVQILPPGSSPALMYISVGTVRTSWASFTEVLKSETLSQPIKCGLKLGFIKEPKPIGLAETFSYFSFSDTGYNLKLALLHIQFSTKVNQFT